MQGRARTARDRTIDLPKYPDVVLKIVGTDGNAASILGRVTTAMRRAGAPKVVRDDFVKEATSGDYDHLLRTCLKWVTVR